LCKAVLEGRGFRPRRFWWSGPGWHRNL